MPHPATTKKVTSILKYLHKHLQIERHINLSATLSANKVPIDYCKIIVEQNAILKIDGGTRGPASYIWNKDKNPDEKLANKIITAYNKLRDTQTRARLGGNGRVTNEKRLINIEKAVIKILEKMNSDKNSEQ